MTEALTKNTFDYLIKKSELPVLVDFWAPWCGPCRMLGPLVDQIAEEYSDQIRVGKVNVEEEVELVEAYGITSVPTLLLFNHGQLLKKEQGFKSKGALISLFKNLV